MGVKNSKEHQHNLKSDNNNNNITNNSKSRNINKKSQNNHNNNHNDDSNDSLIINNNNNGNKIANNNNNNSNNQCGNNCQHQTNNTRKLRPKDQINYSFRPNDMLPVQQVFGYPAPVNNMFASMRARDPRMMSPPGSGGGGYYKTKPSRIQVDPNDPLLISTLPPHLTSVINTHLPPPPPTLQIPVPPPPPPPPQIIPDSPSKDKYSNTYNTSKMSRSKLDLDMTGIDRNFTDPWRTLLKAQQNIKSEKPTKSAMLQELLECPICMNRYDNPHVLPCQHTFCKNCIVTLKSDSRNNENCISCPICRETHILTNGVDGLPANYTMKRLIELEAMAAAEKAAAEAAEAKMKQQKAAKNLKLGSKQLNKSPNSSLSSLQSTTLTTNHRRNGGGKYQRHQDLISTLSVPIESELKRTRLKLILLCHSSAIETQSDNPSDDSIQNDEEIYEDEYGKCKTFSKIGVWVTDRIEKLKEIIQVKFEIPYDEQLLVYKDKILRNDMKQLYQYRIRNYSRIHVFDKRDVKENLNELENDPYYVDQEFIDELTNTSISKNQSKYSKYNTKNTYIERTPRRQESNYYDDTVRSGHRTTTTTRIILNNSNLNSHNGTNKMYQSIGKRRIRKINELFDPPEVVY